MGGGWLRDSNHKWFLPRRGTDSSTLWIDACLLHAVSKLRGISYNMCCSMLTLKVL